MKFIRIDKNSFVITILIMITKYEYNSFVITMFIIKTIIILIMIAILYLEDMVWLKN